MMLVVEEFEKTISQMLTDKEHTKMARDEERRAFMRDKTQVLEDLAAAERAFNDVSRKYSRAKETIGGLKSMEDEQKKEVQSAGERLKKAEERYGVLKTHAEGKVQK